MNWTLVQAVTSRRNAEWGTHFTTDGRVRVALATPTRYFVGMSSLGFQAVLAMLNRFPDVSCERTFLPDDPGEYRRTKTPLFTYESLSPVSSFDMVAISIAYELELPGLLEVLDLSRIPVLREDRGVHHPLVIGGGPLTFANPLPLAPFLDAVVMGEAETVLPPLMNVIRHHGGRRAEVLEALASVPGIYVPGHHGSDLPPLAVAPRDRLPAVSCRVTEETDLAGMFLVEAARGCSRACAYCVMRRRTGQGMRMVPSSRILKTIPPQARRVGLVGAAVTDHPELEQILQVLVDRGLGVGVSSLRADRLNPTLVALLRRAGYRQLTIAADGASERLRSQLGRRLKGDHLVRAAEMAAEAGMGAIKVYAMLGVPGETREDLDELTRLIKRMARTIPVVLAISFFVPKRGTPLWDAPFPDIKDLRNRLKYVAGRLGSRVTLRRPSARWAWVEYQVARGTPKTGLAAHQAWRNGAGFSAWRRALANTEDR